jgi:hypothetical protein
VVAALLGTADLTAGRLAGALLVGAGIAAGLIARPAAAGVSAPWTGSSVASSSH